MKKLGFIGIGNMGGAILRGIIDADFLKQQQIAVCDASTKKMDELSQKMPMITFYKNAVDLTMNSETIIIAVKPDYVAGVINDISPALNPGKAVISIAAGWTTKKLYAAAEPYGAKILRVMPNTPAMVGEGMTAICEDTNFDKDQFTFARGIFDAVGRTIVLPERMFDAVIGLSGSSPAYVFIMIEAMADAGVREGLPRTCAYELSAQAVLGSALMVLDSGTHPASLKDAVASPGGTTIEAVAELEKSGFRSAIIEAIHACCEKSKKMNG